MDLIQKRQSVRKYSDKAISREVLDKCLEAARLAPSACNVQPWRFIIIDDKKIIEKIADSAFFGVYSINTFAKKASVLVAVLTEKDSYVTGMAGYFRGVQYSLFDIGCACEHLVLQAEEEGIGSCYIGWFNESAVKKILNIPRGGKIDMMIALGYPDKDKNIFRKKVRKSLEKIRSFV